MLPDSELLVSEHAVSLTPETYMEVTTRRGSVYSKSIGIPRGAIGNPLKKEEHIECFKDCVNYADKPLPKVNVENIVSMVSHLEDIKDVRGLISLLLNK